MGSSIRNFQIRISEYKRVFFYRTNRVLSKLSFSEIRERSHQHDHIIKSDAFKITAQNKEEKTLGYLSRYIFLLNESNLSVKLSVLLSQNRWHVLM